MRNAPKLPVEMAEITQDWLNYALRTRAPEAALNGFELVNVINGTCTKVRLHLDLNEAGKRAGIPDSVILKGGFEPHSRVMHYMHKQEVHGYADVLPVLKLPSPACYFAEYDAARQQGIVIMEDLKARGVEFCHPLRPQARELVERRLVELAKFHAQTYASAALEKGGLFEWAEPMQTAGEAGHFDPFLQPDTWQHYVDLPRGRATSVYFHDAGWMRDAMQRLAKLATRFPHALLHGDTHLGNLYIDKDGTPGFFDSLPHRFPPMAEVTYHLCCALDPMDRRQWDKELVRFYLAQLASHGVTPPSFEDAMFQFAAFIAFGFCIFMVNEAVWQPETINTAYTARFSAAMIEHDTLGALRKI
jgi:hypothetical protein